MKAVDTNVVVRHLVKDDPAQSEIAEQIIGKGVLIPHTVLLETAWVLTSQYAFDRVNCALMLETLLELESVTVENSELARWALNRTSDGADIADMLHLAGSIEAEAFVTFDRNIARKAGPESPVPIETLKA